MNLLFANRRPPSRRTLVNWLSRAPAVLACLLMSALVPVPATASDEGGWYAGVLVGRTYNGADTANLSGTSLGSGGFAIDFEEALSFGASGGYSFPSGLRLEGEYLYRTNELESVAVTAQSVDDGDYSSVGVAGNILFDFRRNKRVRPYVGVGAVWIQEVDIDFESGGRETSFETDGFGVQAMGGVQFDVAPRWVLDFQIRSLDADEVEMEQEAGSGVAAVDYAPVNLQLAVLFRF